ncbi:MAG TPA: phytanoyl-CoA dioxygenase family protein [Candidatus Binataceae bacterium]|nr:phytanoyl-CoA dioxygenase family protein [Candidatus Binataceae bacterium]
MNSGSEVANELIDGNGFALLPDLISRDQAHAARELLLDGENVALVPGAPSSNPKTRQRTIRGLLERGEIFERLVQHPAIMAVAEAMLGDDMTLSSYAARILEPGAIEMGAHVDYPYWAMRGPFTVRPALMLQVIWLMQDFTADNGATMVVPRSQLRCAFPDPAAFAREALTITGNAGSAIVSHGLLWHDTGQNHTEAPRVSMLVNYGMKIIHPMESDIGKVSAEVLARATPKMRQLLGLEFQASLGNDLKRRRTTYNA